MDRFKKFVFPAALLFVLLAATGSVPMNKKAPPVVSGGVMDLADWEFDKDGPVALEGDWKFRWMENEEGFIASGLDDSDWNFYSVPGYWNNLTGTPFGYGWFRAKVENLKGDHLALFLRGSQLAFKVFIDGEEVLANGKTGLSREEMVPRKCQMIAWLPEKSSFTIAWNISNFHDLNGGPSWPLMIGRYSDFATEQTIETVMDFFIIGIILMMGLYHFQLWIKREKDRGSLYFAILCFSILVRILSNHNYLTLFFQNLPFYQIILKIDYLTITCSLLSFQAFIKTVFPRHTIRGPYLFFLGLHIFFALIFIVTPSWIFTFLLMPYQIIVIITICWILLIIIRAFKDRQEGAAVMLTGFIFIFLAVIYDIVSVNLIDVKFSIIQYALVIFIFAQSVVLSNRFANAYETSSHLSENLKDEVEKQTATIKKQNDMIKLASREKTDFFINLTHEIKTPLTLITNYLDKYIKKKGRSRDLDVVELNIHKMRRDILNFMDYEKLERGQVFYDHSSVTDISKIFSQTVVLFRATSDKKNISVESDVQQGLFLKADPSALDRIFNNLFDNSIKFTPAGGRIKAVLRAAGEKQLEIIISDTGSGIAPELQENIFKPYFQISHAKRNAQGIGMGLNIVNKIVHALGGTISLKSVPGEGAAFSIVLKSCEPVNEEKGAAEKGASEISLTAPSAVVTGRKFKSCVFNKELKTVYIVEDNHEMLAYLIDSLAGDYNVYHALNGREALNKIDSIPLPDIILSDIMMDEMDGYEFYEELTKQEVFKGVPFIFLTARTTHEEKIQALLKGAVDFINKPFKIEEVTAKIEAWLRLHESRDHTGRVELENKILKVIRGSSRQESFVSFEQKCAEYNLTNREKDVLRLLLKGKDDNELGNILHISYNTVRSHIKHIFEKCGVSNRIELSGCFKNLM